MSSSNKKSPAGSKRPVAPPAFRPQPTPKAAQLKKAGDRKTPVAPPVYRPQPMPKVLQTKKSSAPTSPTTQKPQQRVAPAVYRPEAKKLVQPKAVSPGKQHGGGVVMLMELRKRGGGSKEESAPPIESPRRSEVRIEERKTVPPNDDKASWRGNPCNFQSILSGSFGEPFSLGRFDGLAGKRIRRGATLYRGSISSDFQLSSCGDDDRVYFTTCKARADEIGNTMEFTVTSPFPAVYTGGHGGDHVEDVYLQMIGAYYSSKECEVVMLGKIAKNCLESV